MVSMAPRSFMDSDDNKYAKMGKNDEPSALSKYSSAMDLLNTADVKKLFQNRYGAYVSFLLVGSVAYYELGGSILHAQSDDLLQWASALAEAFGLLTLGSKIKSQNSVSGISGMTFLMYCIVYAFRQCLLVPGRYYSLEALDGWVTEILLSGSLVMVLEVAWSIFRTHRKTYQSELDTLHAKYLVPGCFLLSLLVRPNLTLETPVYTYFWSSCLYLDVLALMPQVVMMSRSGGKVQAPISNFVAVTALSRSTDLWAWCQDDRNDLVTPFSRGLIIAFHVLHLLLVADFMYYYIKARLSGKAFSEDVALPSEEV